MKTGPGDPALTVSLALAAGTLCQGLAHHLRIPGIVLLLAAGAFLGPDGIGWVQPDNLGDALQALVGFAVAVILFEGGMNLDRKRILRESDPIRRLVTLGAVITAVLAAVSARYLMDWDWRLSILFGTLVIVTGPTVVTPLVRRLRLDRNVATVLEAEGVLIDPVGAIIAVVALEVAIQPSGLDFSAAVLDLAGRMGLGAGLGLAGGFLIAGLLRFRNVIPDGLENIFTLSLVLAVFHVSNLWEPESGIAAVTVAGMVVGNMRTRGYTELAEFKEQLTVMLIGLLFVLLSADVRFSEVQALGWRGLAVVAALMFVVRPINVLACTAGSELPWRSRLFLFWMAPRGIVAAAVASFFALTLDHAGIPGGHQLQALVFLVIAVTVLVSGLTGGLVASALGVRRPAHAGTVILGAGYLGRALAAALRDGGESITLIDSSADQVKIAEEEKFRVVFGNAMEEGIRLRAGIESAESVIGMTPNDEVNLLFAREARHHKVPRVYVALQRSTGNVTDEMVTETGARLLFGTRREIDLWRLRLRRGTAERQTWVYTGKNGAGLYEDPRDLTDEEMILLPLVRYRGDRVELMDEDTTFDEGDRLSLLLFTEKRDTTHTWLEGKGWRPLAPPTEPTAEDPATAEDVQPSA